MGRFRLAAVAVAFILALASPPAAAEGPLECEPVVVGVDVDETTTPPTITPILWIREECIIL